ncbi:ABC transporter permease subunit [Tundrisphaera sp. TA3]|uniref:ABC transporter permease subunit n=1 Tax=Tundrisphaera sp. TA3 TaxID=3435775 RepID=UPI003EBA721B
MRHVPTLLRRELSSYFLGPMAFLILLAFQVVACLNFWNLVDALSVYGRSFSGMRDPLNSYVTESMPFWIGMMVAIPALTMRLIAEERRAGTLEPLLTAPVTESEVVVSKWLAGVGMYLMLLVPFGIYLPFLYYQGNYRFDLGPVIALVIGLTTMGMMLVSIGLFFSSLTRNQVVAAISTFAAFFLLIVLTAIGHGYAVAQRASWADAIQYVSVLDQVRGFGSGQLDLRFLVLHLSACVLMLYLTVKVVEYRREG